MGIIPEVIPDNISLDGFTRKELSQRFKVSQDYLRRVFLRLRKVSPEFNFLPGDHLMTPRDYELFLRFWKLSKQKTLSRALDHVKKYGL
jgi:AraC-like DNA-binding protein